MDKSQKDVLVSMTTHETSINPFIVPETNFAKVENQAEFREDAQFGHLDRLT